MLGVGFLLGLTSLGSVTPFKLQKKQLAIFGAIFMEIIPVFPSGF